MSNILVILLIACEAFWTITCLSAGLFQLSSLSAVGFFIGLASLFYRNLPNPNLIAGMSFTSFWYLTLGARAYLVGAMLPSIIFFGFSAILIVLAAFGAEKK